MNATRAKPRHARRISAASWTLIAAIPALLFLVVPVLPIIPMSFTAGYVVQFPPAAWGLTAYRNLLSDDGWRQTLLFSLEVATVSVVLSVVSATLAAIGLTRIKLRAESLVTAVILIPLSMPVVVLALGTFQFFVQIGLTGTLVGISLAHAILGIPYVFLTVRAALTKLDISQVRSAMSLGAGTLSVLRWVYLPAIRPAIIFGALLVFVVSFDEVVIALFNSAPGAITFPVRLFTDIQFNLSPVIMAVSTLLLAAVVALVAAGVTLFSAGRIIQRLAVDNHTDNGR
jgi:putative spermidine/putrescine transport system permease protein